MNYLPNKANQSFWDSVIAIMENLGSTEASDTPPPQGADLALMRVGGGILPKSMRQDGRLSCDNGRTDRINKRHKHEYLATLKESPIADRHGKRDNDICLPGILSNSGE